jgi:hypothetical protein
MKDKKSAPGTPMGKSVWCGGGGGGGGWGGEKKGLGGWGF